MNWCRRAVTWSRFPHRRMRRTLPLLVLWTPLQLGGCHSAVPLPPADEIVAGRASAATDTIDDNASVRIDRARWSLRQQGRQARDFWGDIAVLDMAGAELAARWWASAPSRLR